jgi:hypothetical protein
VLLLLPYNKKRRIFFIIIIAGLIIYVGYNMFNINSLFYNVNVVKASLTSHNVKAGLYNVESKTIETTDKKEIEEIITTIKKKRLYRILPDLDSVPANPYNRIELNINFLLDTNESLEYYITSEGNMKVISNNNIKCKTSNVNIFAGNAKAWFEQLKALYDSKEQNGKWLTQ